MKKIFTSCFILCLLSAFTFGQSKQFVLFEHFTQASCPPCATQNPVFQEGVMATNRGSLHHIAYHTSWPGTDPMHDANPAPVQSRVDYYSVTGVPSMIMNGRDIGGPSAADQAAMIDAQLNPSALQVTVSETENADGGRDVVVSVTTKSEMTEGDLVLRTAIVEREVSYASAPGTNGETFFPNVYRASLNDMAGTAIEAPAMGETTSWDFSYDIDPTWVDGEMYVIAWVQDDDTKQVINSGSSLDPGYAIIPMSDSFKEAGEEASEFSATVEAIGTGSYEISLVSTQPDDWSATMNVGGEMAGSSTVLDMEAGDQVEIQVMVEAGTTPAVGQYDITVAEVGNEDFDAQSTVNNVISNVWDLVITNGAESSGFTTMYSAGLTDAENVYNAEVDYQTYLRGTNQQALGSVRNLYFNVGWTFPSLTNDKVAAFKDFLDNGGNMLIAGQDIGWESGTEGYNTPETLDFYNNYMHANYIDDGGTGNASLTPVESDEIFGDMGASDIQDMYDGNYYPDEIEVIGDDASAFMTYNGEDRACGSRVDNGTYKLVYLGVGIEMIADEAVRSDFMTRTHNWFYAGITDDPTTPPSTGVDIETTTADAVNVYPNPSTDVINIATEGGTTLTQVQLFDITGQLVKSLELESVVNASLDVSDLPTGIYHLEMNSSEGKLKTSKVSIVR